MTGRTFQGMRGADGKLAQLGTQNKDEARFPKLTDQMRRIIAVSALKNARDNYMKKYDEEIQRMMKDQVKAAQRIDDEAARKQAEQTCSDWAENAVLPASKAPKASNAGRWIAVGIIAAVAIVASIFTFGAAAAAGAVAITAVVGTTAVSVSAGAIATGVAVAAAGTAAGLAASAKPVGQANVDQWNYKESVTTVFNYETGECFKTKITQNCNKTKKNYCKEWAEEVEETTSVNLLGKEE
jgi:predicted phage tail protein